MFLKIDVIITSSKVKMFIFNKLINTKSTVQSMNTVFNISFIGGMLFRLKILRMATLVKAANVCQNIRFPSRQVVIATLYHKTP